MNNSASDRLKGASTRSANFSSHNKGRKSSRQALQERELLPAVPSGASLGDFVVWKVEAAASSAWSTDSGKAAKGASLRDILKEQEKKVSSGQHQTSMPAPKKFAPQSTRGNGSSWSSPAKAASAIQNTSNGSSESNNKVDEDLFCPVERPKQETKHSSPNEEGKSSRKPLQERELLPAVPPGPSLGDFVVWKGEATASSAWSTDSGTAAKGASLRDVLKEQNKNVSSGQHQTPMPAPKKSVAQSTHRNGSSWASPAKAASAIPITSHGSSQSNNKVDDDLFWGPLEHLKQETNHSSPNEEGKSSRQALQERELLPAVPPGPSLGDFVVWKGEATASSAWSTDSGKAAKGASLRDVLKEQKKNVSSGQHQTPMPAPKKSVAQSTHRNGSSWSSPAKAASAIPITSHGSSQSNNKVDDDLFWGPLEHPKQETNHSSPNAVGKSSRQALQERELLPAVPSGPSLGDFVVWKEEAAASSAWSTDSGKVAKGASLRDVLREQEKNVSSSQHKTPMPAPKKSAPQSTRGNGSSSSSPAKAASAIQITSHSSSQSDNKVEDDLFWGPLEHPKQETKQIQDIKKQKP